MIEFTVYGTPTPEGSKVANVNKKTGRAFVRDANDKILRPWRQTVAAAAIAAMNDQPLMLDGPIYISIRFYFKRPQAHYGTGRNAGILKPNAPVFCTTTPDKDKLERAVFDALSDAGVWVDDARVADGNSQKFYAGPGAELAIPGCVIEVRPIHTDVAPLAADDLSEQGVLL